MKKLIIILSVLAVIGGAVALIMVQDAKKQKAIQMAAQAALDQEVKSIKALTIEIITRADKLDPLVSEARKYTSKYSKYVIEREKKEATAPSNSKEPGKPASKYAPTDDRDGVPRGMMTREQLDRMRAKKRGEPVKETTEEKPESEPEPEPAQQIVKKAVVDEGPPETEISILARKVTDAAQKVYDEAKKVKDLIAQGTAIRDRAIKAPNFAIAKKEAERLPDLLTGIKSAEKVAKRALSDAKSSARNVEAYISKQASDKEKLRKQLEEQETVQRQIAQAKVVLESIPPLIQKNDFKKAYTTISKSLARFSKDEALEILELEVVRCKYMVELKIFIKEELVENPYKWGWMQDKPHSDIIGATDVFVQTTTKRIGWDDVKATQTIKIINHVLGSTMKPKSTKAKMYFAAAIYCKNQEGGEALATQYAAKAMQLSSKYQAEEKRLLR